MASTSSSTTSPTPPTSPGAPGASPYGAAHLRRITGVTVPLFSIRSERSWGIGEIGDLPELASWIATAGLSLVQLLPLGEIAGGETSPYFALSAFGIDPMFISLAAVPDLPAARLPEALGDDLPLLEVARKRPAVDYELVRRLKRRALRFAFERFEADHHAAQTERAAELRAFVARHADWLPDYARFRAIKDARGGAPWYEWPEALRRRDPAALDEVGRELAREVLYHEYLQWLAHTQWEAARAELKAIGVEIMGDLPFMVARDSADVWAHQDEFRNDYSVGVPPDQFNEDGQDWGLPPYWWDRMRANGFAWLRRRARYTGTLYDRFRIDHLVGFYRTYMRPEHGRVDPRGKLVKGVFDPAEEPAQRAHGAAVVRAMIEGAAETGARLIAEDLGIVPPFVRQSLTELGVPGYKVLIWEKDDNVFRDPRSYPALSVACFGTHDTDPISLWWESRTPEERGAVAELHPLAARRASLSASFTAEVHRALLDLIHGAGSDLVLLLMQDVLGTRERINTPATIGPHNWTYRLPGTPADLDRDPAVRAALARVRESIHESGRG